jgi:L-ribulose-5-phosphate 4-epimerase
MLERLKQDVCHANLDLVRTGLVIQTFGNVSGVDRDQGLVVIKPSGVPYDRLKARDMVVLALDTGRVVEGKLKPSSDTPTHLVLYRAFKELGGIVHTHSLHATAWAQSGRPVPALGTTHADYCHGPIPCTRSLRPHEIESDYEANTGQVIVEALAGHDPFSTPGILVANHGPFAWGKSVNQAVEHAGVLEFLVQVAAETLRLFPYTKPMQQALLDKHFFRKHGSNASYGQAPPPKAAVQKPKER